jgi:hypothetical protein
LRNVGQRLTARRQAPPTGSRGPAFQSEVVKAAAAGRAAQPDAPAESGGLAALPLERVALLDLRSPDIRREYLASAPGRGHRVAPGRGRAPGPVA